MPRPKRKKITDNQLERLTALFEVTDSPSFDQRSEVGCAVVPTMTPREVSQAPLSEPHHARARFSLTVVQTSQRQPL